MFGKSWRVFLLPRVKVATGALQSFQHIMLLACDLHSECPKHQKRHNDSKTGRSPIRCVIWRSLSLSKPSAHLLSHFRPPQLVWHASRRESSGGMEWLGVWNGWGYGIAFFRALNFQISEPEIWRKSLFCGISGTFLELLASEKYFSDSGKWPFHTPPIHTPTKCRPSFLQHIKL